MAGNQTQVVIGPFAITTIVAVQEDALAQSQARRAQIDGIPLDFLGCGIVTPFRRGSKDIVNDCEVELVRSAVSQILGTRAAHGDFLGDLPWRPDFGNKLWILRHRMNDTTLRGQVVAYVLEALSGEPRVHVTEIESEPNPDAPNELQVRVSYQVISENVDDNRVFMPEFIELVRIVA